MIGSGAGIGGAAIIGAGYITHLIPLHRRLGMHRIRVGRKPKTNSIGRDRRGLRMKAMKVRMVM